MISLHMHDIVSEFNRVIFELRSAHLYIESELLLVTRQMTFRLEIVDRRRMMNGFSYLPLTPLTFVCLFD